MRRATPTERCVRIARARARTGPITTTPRRADSFEHYTAVSPGETPQRCVRLGLRAFGAGTAMWPRRAQRWGNAELIWLTRPRDEMSPWDAFACAPWLNSGLPLVTLPSGPEPQDT
eukprot:5629819-Prymnesium_polylepis.1